ncbi:hypothetical protein GCM10020000_54230 [Streptomyces olivoverticillatus]
MRLEQRFDALALGVDAVGLALHEPLGLFGGDGLQLAAADGEVADEGARGRIAAAGEAVVVAEGGVPGDVQAGAVDAACDGVEIAVDAGVAELLVLVAQGAVGVPEEFQAAVLDALVVLRVAGVGVELGRR